MFKILMFVVGVCALFFITGDAIFTVTNGLGDSQELIAAILIAVLSKPIIERLMD